MKIEYEIIKKEWNENGFLFIEFYYWINNERSKESISIPGMLIDSWENELNKILENIEQRETLKLKVQNIEKNIILGVKKEFKQNKKESVEK